MSYEEYKALIRELHHGTHIFHTGIMGEGFYLQVRFPARCAQTGAITMQHCRKWYISRHMTTSEVVQTALLACITAAEHEVREHFTFREQKVANPHFNLEARAALMKHGMNKMDVRQP